MRKIRLISGLIVSALFVAWLASRVQLEVLWSFWPSVALTPIALAALLAAALVLAEAKRLQVACSDLDTHFGALVRMQLVAVLMSNFGLGQAGGDLYRVIALRAFANNYGQATARILATRVIGLVSVIVLGLWGIVELAALLPTSNLSWKAWVLIGAGVVLIGATAGVVLSARLRAYLSEQWADLKAAFAAGRLLAVVFLSVLIAVLRSAQLWLLLVAVGVSVPPHQAAAIVALTLLASTLPLSYGSWGVREGVIVALLSRLKVSFEPALVVAVLGRVLLLCTAAAGAFVFVLEKSKPGEMASTSGNPS